MPQPAGTSERPRAPSIAEPGPVCASDPCQEPIKLAARAMPLRSARDTLQQPSPGVSVPAVKIARLWLCQGLAPTP